MVPDLSEASPLTRSLLGGIGGDLIHALLVIAVALIVQLFTGRRTLA